MDLDLGFLSAVLCQEGGYYAAKRGGVVAKMLEGPAVKGWKFIEDHVLEFGAVPTEEFFSAKTEIDLQDVSESVPVLIGDLVDRTLWNGLKATHEKMGVHLEGREPKKALQILQETVHKSYKDGLSGSSVGSLLSHGDEVLAFYERMKKGERGILAPWQAMNDVTLGWWGGDLIVFVARMGVGKTFAMLMLAREAWMQGKKVLFVGTEMNRTKLALRFYSIHLHLPYRELRRGQLSTIQENKMREAILSMSNESGLDVVGDDFDAQMGEIESAVEQSRPDILFVDGLYLVKNKGHSRHEMVSETADDLKRLARRRNIPVVASTQFNRDVSNNSKGAVSAGNIGITDVIGWDSDVIFGMYQTEDMKEDKMMGYRPIKLRESEGQDFFSKWDFETMQFPQEDVDLEGEFQDGDYGTVPGVAVNGKDEGFGSEEEDSLF